MGRLRTRVRYLRKALETWGVMARELGWKRSFEEKRSVDAAGKAVPWYTYPAIEFLDSLDFRERRVFEFGCGNSSVYWARVAKDVTAVEDAAAWAASVRELRIANLTLIEEHDKGRYVTSPERAGIQYDVVVIDGRFRRECVPSASRVTRSDGMIILDNADWYPEACADIRNQGWFQVDFSGFGPINPYCWTTAVFIRTELQTSRSFRAGPRGARILGPGEGAD